MTMLQRRQMHHFFMAVDTLVWQQGDAQLLTTAKAWAAGSPPVQE